MDSFYDATSTSHGNIEGFFFRKTTLGSIDRHGDTREERQYQREVQHTLTSVLLSWLSRRLVSWHHFLFSSSGESYQEFTKTNPRRQHDIVSRAKLEVAQICNIMHQPASIALWNLIDRQFVLSFAYRGKMRWET